MPSASTVAELQVVVGADTSDAEKSLESFGKKVNSAGAALGAAFVGAGLAVAAGAAVAVKAAGDLEQSVANIKTIKPEIDTSAVAASLTEMSTHVAQSSSQLADSLYNVFSSVEVSQEQAVGLVQKFAQGAVAAQTDAETFGTAVMGVMNAYGMAAEDASHISDVFFNTIKLGVVTGPELAASLGPVTQSAKMAGVSLDELGAMIAAVTKEGGPAAQNINNLNNFLQKITTTEAQKALKALGVQTKTSTGAFRPTAEILADLKTKLGGMTQAARANALQAIFPDAQARTGAATLISQLDLVTSATKENAEASGVADEAYKTMAGTLKSQSTLFVNSLMAVATTIGMGLLPPITDLLTVANEMVAAWMPTVKLWADQIPAAINDTIAAVKAFMSQLALAGAALAGIETADYENPWNALKDAISYVTGEITAYLQPALTWLTQTGWPTLKAVMADLAAWWATVYIPTLGLIVSWLVDKVGVALTWLTTTGWPLLQAAMVVVGAWVTTTLVPTLTAAWSWLTDKLGAALTWLTETGWPKLGEAANKVQNWIKETLIPTLTDWYSWLDQKLQPIYTWFTEQGWPLLQAAGATVWTWLTGTLFPALSEWYDWLQARLSPIFQWFVTDGWPKLQAAGAVVVAWVVGPLAAALKDWYEWLQDRLSPIFQWFTTEGWPAFQTAGGYVWNWLVTNLIPALQDWYSWMGEKAKGAAEWWIAQGFPKLSVGFKDLNPQVAQGAKDWTAFADALSRTDAGENWVAILANLSAFGKYLIDNIKLGDWFNDITNGAAAASGWADYIAEAVAWITRTIKKWSDALPGQRNLPDVEEPPKPPSGNSGGGGGGGSGAVPAPPDFTAPPDLSPSPSPSPSPGPSPSPAPSPSPGPGGSVPPGFPNTDIAQYITAAAQARGIDPATALTVAKFEGGLTEYAKLGDFSGPPWYSGKSWWPFQLHYGGAGTPYAAWGSTAGQGNDFTKATGWQPGDTGAWKASTDWALNIARGDGWKQWYGAAAAGIGRWQGIPGHAGGGWAGLHGPELAWLGERGPEYVVPNSALRGSSGGAMETLTINVAIGGRVAEEIVVEGYGLAARRGRLPAVPGLGAS